MGWPALMTPIVSVVVTAGPVRDFEAAQRQDTTAYAAFFHAMLDRSVYLPPSGYEAWFLGAAHGRHELELIIDAISASI